MERVRGWIAVIAFVGAGAAPQDALVRARQLYNQLDFDGAIVAAEDAGRRPGSADSAGVVLARAYLGRYRASGEQADLTAARAALVKVDPARLSPRDRGEWTIGLGEALYFAGDYGAAAETFDAALAALPSLDSAGRERVLRWWAQAIDHQAHAATPPVRQRLYRRLLQRMEHVLASDAESTAAAYWLAAAATGLGDLDRAWDVAVAAWLRAPLAGAQTASARAELEDLVERLIIPGRARESKVEDRARREAELKSEWEAIRQAWSRR